MNEWRCRKASYLWKGMMKMPRVQRISTDPCSQEIMESFVEKVAFFFFFNWALKNREHLEMQSMARKTSRSQHEYGMEGGRIVNWALGLKERTASTAKTRYCSHLRDFYFLDCSTETFLPCQVVLLYKNMSMRIPDQKGQRKSGMCQAVFQALSWVADPLSYTDSYFGN